MGFGRHAVSGRRRIFLRSFRLKAVGFMLIASRAPGRRTGVVGVFHGGKSFLTFPLLTISPWAKKSPSGVAPEGLKSLERLEPSRRAGGGDDGYNNGGQAKGGFAQCCRVAVHLFGKRRSHGGEICPA